MPSFIGKTPINQQNALPLITVDATANGGSVAVIGGVVTRFWGPADTNINVAQFVGDPDDGTGGVMMLTNFFDVTGCNRFQAVVSRTCDTLAHDTTYDAARVAVNLKVQYRSAGVSPRTGTIVGNADAWSVGAFTPIGGNNLPVGQQVYPMTQVICKNIAVANDNPATGATQGAMMGSDVRLWFSCSTAPFQTGITWSVSLWGTT